MNKQTNPEQLFLSVKQVGDRYGVSVDSIWRWVRLDQFLRPVKLGGQTTRWRLSDFLEHESTLVAGCTTIFDWDNSWPEAAVPAPIIRILPSPKRTNPVSWSMPMPMPMPTRSGCVSMA